MRRVLIRVLSLMIAVIIIVNGSCFVFADNEKQIVSTPFENEVSETVEINGIKYIYYCYLDNNNNAVRIYNCVTGEEDIVICNRAMQKIMLNGDAIGEISQCRKLSGGNIKAGWETISSYYENVTWAQGTNSTVLAAIIATVLGFCGPAAVIACVGMITLGALANACINCTLQIDLQQFVIDISYIQYRYIWSIIVSATESYGPYIYTV